MKRRTEPDPGATQALLERWHAHWPAALACWSRYTRLHPPRIYTSTAETQWAGLHGSFAMIRLADQGVVVDLQAVRALGLDDYAVEILAHEIGHHVLAPGTASMHLRMLARVRRVLGPLADAAPLVANLYTDLCINDRLQRQCGLRMDEVYRVLGRDGKSAAAGALWALYLRIYEQLWQLAPRSLGGAACEEAAEADAWLGARTVRVYADEPLTGVRRFAALLLPYLPGKQGLARIPRWQDTRTAAAGCAPGGLHVLDEDEDGEGSGENAGEALHPAWDVRVTGDTAPAAAGGQRSGSACGQAREPFEYGEILRLGGSTLSPREAAMRYYRERALPYLVPFPKRTQRQAPEQQFEGYAPWSLGDPLEDVDWARSLAYCPHPVPGLTLLRRVHGEDASGAAAPLPIDLDLYVDSSGSMPDPQRDTSQMALAGAIVALSALRSGAAVQVTLWSGKREVLATPGFTRDADQVLRVLTGYFGGATCFPIHRLRATYAAGARPRPTHILMISDDGITSMFDEDERGESGWTIAARALAAGTAGGTMALNLASGCDAADSPWYGELAAILERARREQGWDIHAVPDLDGLVAFAYAFSHRLYARHAEGAR
ncbi:VWA domain-containing protein [Massilia sp. MS-15]|uniref:VWA domain-containing protein n=1 Tax=Massilia sp. MS-15 TaxID=2878200 RepID=UPI001CD4FF8F|nr:VWA domain-containing protein [Massilia sp. MS-15]MCA1246158.1 VWA domain-containing protein [Massilia sp. MS-15]